ncbi:MAG: hypothetical protein J6Q15_03545 [Clostridia bacterium]|nr:hypothetical protein [Clostridia bacterium]
MAVGLTDGTYNTNILLNDGQFSVDLTLVPSHPTRPRYEIENNGNTAIIEPIANIVADLDIYDFKQISFVYIIAYDKGSYEFWSSSLGYTNEYIAISKEALTPYVAE